MPNRALLNRVCASWLVVLCSLAGALLLIPGPAAAQTPVPPGGAASMNIGITWSHYVTLPGFPGVMAAVSDNNLVVYSQDGGRTWKRVTASPWGDYWWPAVGLSVRQDSNAPVRILVAAENKVYRSGDFGNTWAEFTLAAPPECNSSTADANAIIVSPADPNVLYLTAICGFDDPPILAERLLYVSTDAGVTWSYLRSGVTIPLPSPVVPGMVFVRRYGWDVPSYWLKSIDYGHTWSDPMIDDREHRMDLALDGVNALLLYVWFREGYPPRQPMRSIDGGVTWVNWASEPPCLGIDKVIPSRIVTALVLVHCDHAVYRSDDAGDHWQLVGRVAGRIESDLGQPERLLLEQRPDGFWISTDFAGTWTHLWYDLSGPPKFVVSSWPLRTKPSDQVGIDPFIGGIDILDVVSARDAWAVVRRYDNYVFLHWDGIRWQEMERPQEPYFEVDAVDFVKFDDGWAMYVGSAASFPINFVHWDGIEWTSVFTETDAPLSHSPAALAMVSSEDGWAAGRGNVWHWDGEQWQPFPVPTTVPISTFSFFDTETGWAAGPVKHLLRWDGSAWTLMDIPTAQAINAIDTLSATSAWAVGDGGAILHWDGRSWNTVDSPVQDRIYSLDMVADDEGWAIAAMPDARSCKVLHWDGASWSASELPNLRPLNGNGLDWNAVAMASRDVGWMVGSNVTILSKASFAFLPETRK